ncbi:hypothetical protein KSC_013820 [Ktedonobacter sp. SOSP1-52]|uniref:hypothetical protein n=1 Tax=Ktedonobacter sp. SOSP1-52 TaxID=2778366 RepID=UPI0019156834|nr:hypothetical protein [Ktedonobacter sp. SOSP1-52]GHO62490.1 hypothetical protein KSC_013820 [Ktedonobacter sp. SOSP1-52]
MPKTPAATLTWSPESNAYKLHASDQRPMWIELGIEGLWFAWLTTHTLPIWAERPLPPRHSKAANLMS